MAEQLLARGLCVRRQGRLVLDRVDLSSCRGEILAIAGPNGAGKSTLLKALAGLVESEGELTICGRPLRSLDLTERARLLAYVPQRSMLRSGLRVEEVVAQGCYGFGGGLGRPGKRDLIAVRQALEAARADALAGRRYTELSVGEQQRVLMARALATEAPFLLLDEPTAALDVAEALATFELLGALVRGGRAVVLVVHSLDDARRHAQQCLLLDVGRVVARGRAADVIAAEPIRSVYDVELLENAALGFRPLPEREP